MPAGCENDSFVASQDGLWEEKGSKARVCGVERRGVWMNPIQARLRRMTNESWTDPVHVLLERDTRINEDWTNEAWTAKHRNVMGKLVVARGWVPTKT